jgi:tricorn protease-like protein
MKLLKKILILGLFLFSAELFGQYLPESYQPMFNEIVTFFETIRSGNSLQKGSTSLRIVNENKIVLRVKHKGQVKNLTFETKPDEENQLIWVPANDLTIDMVNKYEDYLTSTFKSMYKLAEKKSKE